MKTKAKTISVVALSLALGAAILGRPLGEGLVTEEFLVVDVEGFRASYWEEAHQDPRTVQYSEDAESFIISYDSNDIPAGLRDEETYTPEEIADIRYDEHGEFYETTLVMDAQDKLGGEDFVTVPYADEIDTLEKKIENLSDQLENNH